MWSKGIPLKVEFDDKQEIDMSERISELLEDGEHVYITTSRIP